VTGIRSILEFPSFYRAFQRAIAGDYRATYVNQYVRPLAGQRIFDIGCGPGDVLDYLPDVDYLGVDINPKYIKAAQARFGGRGTFRCEGVADTVVRHPDAYDIVMANGLLHHLDDGEVLHLLTLASQALKPGGRLVTFDGCFVPTQARLARVLLRMDRGKYVRTPEAYLSLARTVFGRVEGAIRHDLLRIPYSHFIMNCEKSAGHQRASA
jgi:SAM-dependent methyltransferase